MKNSDTKQRKYSVLSYDAEWPVLYKSVRVELEQVFNDKAIKIEHVGSTAVPGMSAKPTIDVLVVVKDVLEVDKLNEKMKELGYDAYGEYVGKGGRFFAKEENCERVVNVHCFPEDHPKVADLIGMRDYLRSHPEESKAYAELKLELARQYPDDYFEYRKAKDIYIQELKKKVENWNAGK
ncbi:MAG: GrpB family protein [Patescibacteria group bacterium]|nr:GrpB family protein [Patescibacteria group bacterium]